MDDERKPVGDVLVGCDIYPLEEGWVPFDAVVIVKALDDDGDVRWCVKSTSGVNEVDCIGALQVTLDHMRKEYLERWE